MNDINAINKSKFIININDFKFAISTLNFREVDNLLNLIETKNISVFVPIEIETKYLNNYIEILDQFKISHNDYVNGFDV